MSFSIFILLVDKGTPFNIHIAVGLTASYFIVERAKEPPNKSLFLADITSFAVSDLDSCKHTFGKSELHLYGVIHFIIIGP